MEAIDVDIGYEPKHNSRKRRVEAIDVDNTEDIQSEKGIAVESIRKNRVKEMVSTSKQVASAQSNPANNNTTPQVNVVRKAASPVKLIPGLNRHDLEQLATILAEIQESKKVAAESTASGATVADLNTLALSIAAESTAASATAAGLNTPALSLKKSSVQSSPPISKSDYAALIAKIKSLEESTVESKQQLLMEQQSSASSKTALPFQSEQTFNPTTISALNAMFSNGIPTAAFPFNCPSNAFGAQNSSHYGTQNNAHSQGVHQSQMQGGYNFFSCPPHTVQTSNNQISNDNLLGYLNMTNNSLLAYMSRRT